MTEEIIIWIIIGIAVAGAGVFFYRTLSGKHQCCDKGKKSCNFIPACCGELCEITSQQKDSSEKP